MGTRTLIEMLDVAARDAMKVYSRSDAENATRAAALREAAARLRSEMERAQLKWSSTTSTACRDLLERINNGPLETK